MSVMSFYKFTGPATLLAGLAIHLIIPATRAALPPANLANPPHQSEGIVASPTLTWNRGVTNLLVNGDLETGDETGWDIDTQGFGGADIDDGTDNPFGPDGPTPPLEGTYCVLFQGINFQGGTYSEFSQLVTIPANSTDVVFKWSQLIRNYENVFNNDQYFRLEIRNSGGAVLETPFSTQPGDPTFSDFDNIDPIAFFNWQKGEANLNAYAGQTIRLVFAFSSGLGDFNVRLDRMSLTSRPALPVASEVYLSLNPIPGVADLLGSTTNKFWNLSNLQPNTAYYWRVNSRQGSDFQAGPIWQFRTAAASAPHRFLWETPANASAGEAFASTIRIRDAKGNGLNGIGEPVNLTAVSLDSGTAYHVLGNESFTSFNLLEKTTVGYSFTPSSDLWVSSLRALGGTKVYLWSDEGVKLAQATLEGPDGTWREAILPAPVSLLAGRTYRLGAYGEALTTHYSRFAANTDFAHGTIEESFTIAGDGFPTQPHPAQWWLIDASYFVAAAGTLSVAPSVTGTFVSGEWTGDVSLAQASGLIALLAESASGAKGYSDPILLGSALDSDGDGIPNDWEIAQGMNPNDPSDADLDVDGDGHTGLQEYWSGTDPMDPNSVLSILDLAIEGDNVTLEFEAKAGKTYSVLYTETLGVGAWEKLMDVPSEGSDRIVLATDSLSNADSRVYQVVTPSQ